MNRRGVLGIASVDEVPTVGEVLEKLTGVIIPVDTGLVPRGVTAAGGLGVSLHVEVTVHEVNHGPHRSEVAVVGLGERTGASVEVPVDLVAGGVLVVPAGVLSRRVSRAQLRASSDADVGAENGLTGAGRHGDAARDSLPSGAVVLHDIMDVNVQTFDRTGHVNEEPVSVSGARKRDAVVSISVKSTVVVAAGQTEGKNVVTILRDRELARLTA